MSHHNTELLLYPGMMANNGIFCCLSIAQLRVISKYLNIFFALYNKIYMQGAVLIGSVRLT